MSKNITEILKEATNGILTPEVLSEIEALFDKSVATKAQLQTEAALIAQDEDYTKKLETLINAIDTDHLTKLNKVVEAIDRKRSSQLKLVIEKYEKQLNVDAKSFQKQLVESISNYLEAYLDEKIPTETLEEAVNNKRSTMVLDEIRTKLGVDLAFSQDVIREGVKDGKQTIEDLRNELQSLKEQNIQLTESNAINSAKLLVEQKISNSTPEKKDRVRKMLHEKSAEYITENCDYIIKLIEKNEEKHLEDLKEEALKTSTLNKVDRVAETNIITESNKNVDQFNDHPITNVYMEELQKF